jgi:hypothetical protein
MYAFFTLPCRDHAFHDSGVIMQFVTAIVIRDHERVGCRWADAERTRA